MNKNSPKFIDTFSSLLSELYPLPSSYPIIVAIDGRPCSGKTTLAIKLAEVLDAQVIYLDEFFLSQEQWPSNAKLSFPFFYFRYEEFVEGIKQLAQGKSFSFFSYDWKNKRLSKKSTVVNPHQIILVEGVSTLHEGLLDCYFKKIWVFSDLTSEQEALCQRERKANMELWEKIYLPSINIYCLGEPWKNADIIYAGRGIAKSVAIQP